MVVISIIGLLSSVVLSSLNTARAKARDSAIKQQLSNMRSAAALLYSSTGNFNTVCDSTTDSGKMFRNAFENTNKTIDGGSVCMESDTTIWWSSSGSLVDDLVSKSVTVDQWAASMRLSNGGYFCIDSSGLSRERTAAEGRGIDNSPFDISCN